MEDDAPDSEAHVERVISFEEEVRTDSRKRLALFDQIRQLDRTRKILLALRGGMESRLILLKMYDPMIYFYLCKNPKITVEEIVEISKADLLTPPTVELIARNREWMKNERVKFHLVMNRKTPQATALNTLGLLSARSLKEIARTVGAPPALRRLALKKLQGLPSE